MSTTTKQSIALLFVSFLFFAILAAIGAAGDKMTVTSAANSGQILYCAKPADCGVLTESGAQWMYLPQGVFQIVADDSHNPFEARFWNFNQRYFPGTFAPGCWSVGDYETPFMSAPVHVAQQISQRYCDALPKP